MKPPEEKNLSIKNYQIKRNLKFKNLKEFRRIIFDIEDLSCSNH